LTRDSRTTFENPRSMGSRIWGVGGGNKLGEGELKSVISQGPISEGPKRRASNPCFKGVPKKGGGDVARKDGTEAGGKEKEPKVDWKPIPRKIKGGTFVEPGSEMLEEGRVDEAS